MEASTVYNHSKSFFIDIHQRSQSEFETWMDCVREIFAKEIEPLYGNQKSTLQTVENGLDRRCYLLCDGLGQPKGLLIYKTALSCEYEAHGITQSLEVKTIMVIEPEPLVADRLIKKVKKIAKKLNAQSIHLTANHESNFSLESLRHFGFKIVASFPNRFKEQTIENLLKLSLEKVENRIVPEKEPEEVQQLVKQVQRVNLIEKLKLDRIKTVKNVHLDDIHGGIKLEDQTFITGSKDGSLKKWDFDGNLVKDVFDPKVVDYKNWITALSPLDQDSWIAGTRNGNAYLYDRSGDFVRELKTMHEPYPRTGLSCKQRNEHRINCLASFSAFTQKPLFFAGWPTQFTLHSAGTLRRIGSAGHTSETDWVYAIQPLAWNSLLVVTGCRLEAWKDPGEKNVRWEKQSTLVDDTGIYPRPFISAITPLEQNKSLYGLAVFDGSVRVVDINSEKTIFRKQEHRNRVWTIENIWRDCFASCGDDGLIKLWDIRMKKSSFTVRDNTNCSARVSVLMRLEENKILSGSCPDDVRNSRFKAQFSFWDPRKL